MGLGYLWVRVSYTANADGTAFLYNPLEGVGGGAGCLPAP